MEYILGLDIGITSIGYAVIRLDAEHNPDKIIWLNSIIFPIAENEKGKSYASKRGELRRTRRITRRREFRKYRIKQLFIKYGLLSKNDANEILNAPNPVYELRTKGLDHLLSNAELFHVLYWLGGHRGFKSNRKSELKDKDVGTLLTSLNQTQSLLQESDFRTIGELYYKSEHFKNHKRNKGYDNGYLGSSYRKLIVDEAKQILSYQSQVNQQISTTFIQEYLDILQSQRDFDEGPGANSPYGGNQIEKMIGKDSLVQNRIRASKATFTFNYFDMLSKVNNIQIRENNQVNPHPLNEEQRQIVINKALKNAKTNFSQIKKYLSLPDTATFNLVSYDKNNPEKSTILCNFKAVNDIKKCLPDNLKTDSNLVDQVATILSTYKSDKTRTTKLKTLSQMLPSETIEKLLELNFSQFGHLSVQTMQDIIPFLEKGMIYSDAAQAAGYDFQAVTIDDKYIDENVSNAVVKRAVRKTIKLVHHIISEFGNPYEIHIELARELGKSQAERKEIAKRQAKNFDHNQAIANDIKELGFEVNGQNILKKKLYDEQQAVDFYSKNSAPINLEKALSGDDYYEIDHIIPYSISFDDSFSNKILVSKQANQQKSNRIPMQYLQSDPKGQEWLAIHANKLKNRRKKMLLLKPKLTEDDKKGWKQRNINDTSYMNKLLANYLKQNITFSKDANKQHVYTLNGAVTAKIRNRWGITKNRDASDIHHAVDAVVIACVTNAFVQRVSHYSKNKELRYNQALWSDNTKSQINKYSEFKKFFNDFPLPYRTFREELSGRISDDPSTMMIGKNWENKYTKDEIQNLKPITVVRLPQKKTSGALHKETINSAKDLDKGIISRRVTIDQLKIKKNQIVYDSYVYPLKEDGGNQYIWHLLYEKLQMKQEMEKALKKVEKAEKTAIQEQINQIFPGNALVFTRNGHQNIIRKFRVIKHSTKGVVLNHGTAIADNEKGSMLRVDVFTNQKQYLLVPVYKGDIKKKELPNSYISKKKNNKISDNDQFLFSLFPNDLVHIKFKQPKLVKMNIDNDQKTPINEILGYYKSIDSSSGAMNIMASDNSFSVKKIGVANLPLLEKYQIDYLGRYHLVHESKRQTFHK